MRVDIPRSEEFLEVAGAPHLLPRDRAVHRDLVSLDVLDDAIVGGGRTPRVVFGLQSVDRHDDLELGQPRPFPWDRPDCARDELGVDLPFRQLRQNLVKLAIADERLSADNRHVERSMAIDKCHEARDQLVALVVGEAAQRHATAKVIVAVGVASGTSQRTFARDLDRDVRAVARKDAAPSLDDFSSANAHSITISPVILSEDAR